MSRQNFIPQGLHILRRCNEKPERSDGRKTKPKNENDGRGQVRYGTYLVPSGPLRHWDDSVAPQPLQTNARLRNWLALEAALCFLAMFLLLAVERICRPVGVGYDDDEEGTDKVGGVGEADSLGLSEGETEEVEIEEGDDGGDDESATGDDVREVPPPRP